MKVDEIKLALEKNREIAIQLKTVEELRKIFNEINSINSEVEESKKKIIAQANILENVGKRLASKSNDFMGSYENFKKVASSIGVDVPSDIKNLEKTAKESLKLGNSIVQSANKVKGAV
jgi:SMC interacting uncharacterized protein involved in chromosome segregation